LTTFDGATALFSQLPLAPSFPRNVDFQFTLVPALYPVVGLVNPIQLNLQLNVTFLGNAVQGGGVRYKVFRFTAPDRSAALQQVKGITGKSAGVKVSSKLSMMPPAKLVAEPVASTGSQHLATTLLGLAMGCLSLLF
jgi:hypothetical protein